MLNHTRPLRKNTIVTEKGKGLWIPKQQRDQAPGLQRIANQSVDTCLSWHPNNAKGIFWDRFGVKKGAFFCSVPENNQVIPMHELTRRGWVEETTLEQAWRELSINFPTGHANLAESTCMRITLLGAGQVILLLGTKKRNEQALDNGWVNADPIIHSDYGVQQT